jgi:hypothetical protein
MLLPAVAGEGHSILFSHLQIDKDRHTPLHQRLSKLSALHCQNPMMAGACKPILLEVYTDLLLQMNISERQLIIITLNKLSKRNATTTLYLLQVLI